MDDRDIAGEQIGELRQEQRRPQIVHQPFVEKAGRRIALCGGVQDGDIDREIALAAAGGDDHVHPPRISLSPLTPAESSASPAA